MKIQQMTKQCILWCYVGLTISNPTILKKNKGNSIWTFTVTIVGNETNQNYENNTYIVSIGSKESDHSEIEARFLNDIHRINDYENQRFYVASSKKIVKVKIHLIACVADLPERYDTCNISRGNGNFTTRWGYSSHVQVLQKHLRSCE